MFVRARRALHPQKPWPARAAGGWLRVEASVFGVVILTLARRTHGKSGHSGVRPVVWHAIKYRKARTAGSAVQKRVHIPPVARVEQLALAIRANAKVGRYCRLNRAAHAGQYFKLAFAARRFLHHIGGKNHSARRRRGLYPLKKRLTARSFSLRNDYHSA